MESAIRAKLDQHIIAAQAVLYRTIPEGIFAITSHWARGYSGLRRPNFNVFLPLTLTGLSDDTLADSAAFFSNLGAYYTVELIHDRFPDGPDFLDKRGYQPWPPQPAMYLSAPPADVRLIPEVTIEPVKTVPALTAFCTILHRVFDFPLEDMVKLVPVNHLKSEAVRHYLAFWDDIPVGAGTLVCAEGAASIWNLSTCDAHRQRGVATTLLHRMLTDAGNCGYGPTMVYSTAQAFRLFSKMGFEIFTQRQWFLPPGIVYGDE
jgi:GNAT superfamily N-acetyltransferase